MEPEGRQTDSPAITVASLSRCTHRPTTYRRPHTLALDLALPTTPPSPASLPAIISKRLRGFGAMGLGALTRISEPISGYLIAPLAVEGCVRACVCACASSFTPSPVPPPPPPFRPAAVSEIARRPRIH